MWGIIQTFILIVIELLFCRVFLDTFFERRKQKIKYQDGLMIVFFGIFLTGMVKVFREYPMLKMLALIGLIAGIMLLTYRAAFWKMLLAVGCYYGILLVCDYILLLSLQLLMPEWMMKMLEKDVFATVLSIWSKIVELVFMVWINHTFSAGESFRHLDKPEWMRFLAMSVLTLISTAALGADQGIGSGTFLFLSFALLSINLFFFYTMSDIVKKRQESERYRLMKEKTDGQLALFQNMKEAYREQQKRVHDFKCHMDCMQGLLSENRAEEAGRYIERMQQDLREHSNVIHTDNPAVNIIVNRKYQEARSRGITMVMNMARLEYTGMEEADMVVLLSNLLSNAIEACEKIGEKDRKIIKLKFIGDDRKMVLSVANTVSEALEVQEQGLRTAKSEAWNHGLGMQNIREVIEKYGGEGMYRFEDGWFYYTIFWSVERDRQRK